VKFILASQAGNVLGRCSQLMRTQTPARLLWRKWLLAVCVGLAPLTPQSTSADVTYLVKPRDTLTDIARRHGVEVGVLAQHNALKKPNALYPGQRLSIPGSAAKALPAASSLPKQVTVRKRETLTDIARRYGVTVQALAQYNGINPDRIFEGQVLLIPGRQTSPQLEASLQRELEQIRVTPGKWKHIVIHHTATPNGNPRDIDHYHRQQRNMQNGLAYHFLIGNGDGMKDGEIALGHRWTKQLDGGHLASEALNAKSIGICLVGNFDRTRPTAKQMASLHALSAYLLERCRLPPGAITTHQEINTQHTRCPGRHFALDVLMTRLKEAR
jgi:LysM repeat protein